jgi:WbqC-like protein family
MKFSSGTINNSGSLLISTAYLPPVSYVSACLHADEICIEVQETYTKQTFRNHCLICGPNGKQQLSIPVVKVDGNHTKTKDIRLSGTIPWQKMHWRSIRTAYSNSPFFLYYSDYFLGFFEKKQEFLVDFNHSLLDVIFGILKTQKSVTVTEEFSKEPAGKSDMRGYWGKSQRDESLLFPAYTQVFSHKHEFVPDASIIDLIFNLGPEARFYLENLS